MSLAWFRFRFRTLLAMVACFAVISWAWVTFLSPTHLWNRKIRADNESASRWEAAAKGIDGKVPGVDRAEAIAGLCSALSDPSRRVRETAAATLGKLKGPEAKPAVPYLVAALADESSAVRLSSVRSLEAITDDDDSLRKFVEPVFIKALQDKSVDVQLEAGFALTMMGRGELAIPVMRAAIHEGQPRSNLAALCLGLSGADDEVAVKALQTASVRSSSPKIRKASADALKRLKPSESKSKP